ncbi:hypothetical protein X777_14427 [Ooceraea biroi]|uniref:Uncharacterized protein n=1 Tax=Ooceraea biroi TaxID=2015173 RepID=A0A026VYV2_OOCBI|nr:hypothetical protein X777_14427 [Ooceraea biroi]
MERLFEHFIVDTRDQAKDLEGEGANSGGYGPDYGSQVGDDDGLQLQAQVWLLQAGYLGKPGSQSAARRGTDICLLQRGASLLTSNAITDTAELFGFETERGYN